MSEEKPLTFDEAVAMLPDGPEVHTILNPAVDMLIGADWGRDEVLVLVRAAADRGELWPSGPSATAMNHGLTAWSEDPHQPVFIETTK